MADVKAAVTATAKPVAKAVASTKIVEEKADKKKETVKKEAVKKEAVKKETVKKETVKKEAVKKEAVKKEAVKKEVTKKAESVIVKFEFSGKSYANEDLVKIAKDVWKFDLGKKESEFKSVELYVKPEELVAYYVINGNVTGSFTI